MFQTIIVLAIMAAALGFTAIWAYRKLSGKATPCCTENPAACPVCADSKLRCNQFPSHKPE